MTTGAAAGALSGYWLARRAVDAPTPRPAAVHEWHAMSVDQVRAMLPPPESEIPAGDQHALRQRQRSRRSTWPAAAVSAAHRPG